MIPSMFQFSYGNQAASLKTSFSSLPAPARGVVMLAALPGMLIALLSVVLFIVSILSLLLLTMPVYMLMRLVCFSRPSMQSVRVEQVDLPSSPGVRQVDAKVIE